MDQKVSKNLKAKTEMKTSSGSIFYKVEFHDGSNFSFFHATDVEKISAIDPGTKVSFISYQKGTWNNGRDIMIGSMDPDPIAEVNSDENISGNMIMITLHLPPGILKQIDNMKANGLIPNRAEFIRSCLLHNLLQLKYEDRKI